MNSEKYILNNMQSGKVPYCFFNGRTFEYKFGFELNIKINFFESYFKYNFNQIKNLNESYTYLAICSTNGVLKIFKLLCKNHFENKQYKMTSIIMNENIYEFEVIKQILPEYKVKNIDINSINFNSKGWIAFWLFSLGFARTQIASILKISYQNVDKRLFRIKNRFPNCSSDELKFAIKNSGLLYTKIPKYFETHKLVRIN